MTAWLLMSLLVVQLLNGRKTARLRYKELSYHQLLERKQDEVRDREYNRILRMDL